MGDRDPTEPLFSSRAEDPALVEAIEDFVEGLAESIDHLQDAEGEGDLGRLARLARTLARESDEAGYELLGELARSVCMTALAEKTDEARAQLVVLTATARRARMGHPGAF